MTLTILDPLLPEQSFPKLESALEEPNGLIAIGGCLTPTRLINAYQHGIFPWFNEGDPILWWSPEPRCVVYPKTYKTSKSLKKSIKKKNLRITMNTAFQNVMEACAEQRINKEGTWINQEMIQAYTTLHELGIAHSIETWNEDVLVGGLYGVSIGKIFFGESMFHQQSNASKIAFDHLIKLLKDRGFWLVDCQVTSEHLLSVGAIEIPRTEFETILEKNRMVWDGSNVPIQ
jgi:leucyl/phenylalanyl-tRNA---protein transferase